MSEIFTNGISTVPISVQDSSGSLIFFPAGISQSEFTDDTDNLAKASGSILVGSLNQDFEIQLLNNSQTAFYISGSSPDPLIGMGTTAPVSNLDIRSTTGSSPANIILRTNEDGIIEPGEETGRIIFAIESASYSFDNGFDFIKSGSTAAIYSKVINSGSDATEGTHGSLVFEVSRADGRLEPIDILTLGHGFSLDEVTKGGIFTTTKRAIAMFSASLILDGEDGPFLHLRGGTNTGNPYRIADLGVTIDNVSELLDANADNWDMGSLKLFHNSSSRVDLNSYGDYDYIDTVTHDGISKNLGIGTKTPASKLTVEGDISASGDIIGNINGGSF